MNAVKTAAYKILRKIVRLVKRFLPKTPDEVKRQEALAKINRAKKVGVFTLTPERKAKGAVLLSYILEAFIWDEEKVNNHTHSNYWECVQIAKTFLDLGFEVDVINWDNTSFVPEKSYSFVVDIHSNLERLSNSLGENCLKILHVTGAHWLFQNNAEYTRLLNLQKRKNSTLLPRRVALQSWGVENADHISLLGNKFTISTFEYARKPITLIPLSNLFSTITVERDFEKVKKNFLWLGNNGMVHKGLDLVLEAFSEMPEYHLTICGPVETEKDFVNLYHTELYQTENIFTKGWLNTNSEEFEKIVNSCVGLIYPSCSEGQAGSVITCLQLGLIPIISYESGVDVEDFGIILKECTVAEIQNSVKALSILPADDLKAISEKAMSYAKQNHSRESFAKSYSEFIKKIIQEN